jgi:ribosomal protein S18 acetylase RimI-like enzyme
MFTIGTATVDDIDGLVEQGAALFVEDAGRYDTFIDLNWSERHGRADFERLIASDDCLVIVARHDTGPVAHLVGYIQDASPTRQPVTYANLRSLYVEPASRRLGVADQLTRAFVDWARAKGCAEAHVESYTRNEPAQRLYERHGFVTRSTARALGL